MKKLILSVCGCLIFAASFGQKNFKWEKTDSIPKTKSQIYSDTKIFIAKTWKSAQNVIQNDDKESGNIIVKGSSIQKVNQYMNVFTYVYNYTVMFKMKDDKIKIIIDNVYCESAIPVGQALFDIPKIEPFEGEYVKGERGIMDSTLPKKKAVIMMASLKADLQKIVDDYIKTMKTTSSANEVW